MSDALKGHRDLSRSFALEAVAMLATILADRNISAMVRVRAAKLILNLAYGRRRADRVTCAAPQRPL
jgi:hypothetical protein